METTVDYEKLLKLIGDGYENLEKTRGKQIILIFGKSGAGKSTTVNYLLGYNFRKQGRKNLIKIDEGLSIAGPIIGEGALSCTLVPDVYQLAEGIFFVDTAGIGDNRGPTEDIFTKIAVQLAIKCSARIKAIIALVEESQIETCRGMIFSEIAQILFAICRGDEFYKSFYLFVTKKKSTDNIFEVLEDTSQENREAAEQTAKDPNKSQETKSFKQVQAVIQIFLSTKNVIVVDPSNKQQRDTILNMLKQSKPISKQCIGKATNSKTQNQLKELLCNIAQKGSTQLYELERHLKELTQKDESDKLQQKRVVTLKNESEEHTKEINKSTSGVQVENNLKIQKKQEIEKQKQKLSSLQIQKNQINSSIVIQKSQLAEKQSKLKKEAQEVTKNLNKMVTNVSEVTNFENQIKSIGQKIKAAESAIQIQKKLKKTIEEQIKTQKSQIIDLSNIDKEHQVKSAIATSTHYQGCYNQKNSIYTKNQSQLKNTQTKFNNAKNNTSKTQVFKASYNEKSLYGVLKVGSVHTHKFDYSGVTVSSTQKWGTLTSNLGCNGYWSDEYQGNSSSRATYHTPYGTYGQAQFKVYAEYRNTTQGQNEIKTMQKRYNDANTIKKNAEKERDQAYSLYTKAKKDVETQRTALSNRIKKQNEQCQTRIKSHEATISNCNKTITNNQDNIKQYQKDIDTYKKSIQDTQNGYTNSENSKKVNQTNVKTIDTQIINMKNQLELLNQSLTNNSTSTSTCRLSITTSEKVIQNSEYKITNYTGRISSENEMIKKNDLKKKESQKQIQSLGKSISSIKSQIKKHWKSLIKIQENGSIKLIKQIYQLMDLQSKTVDDFLTQYKKKDELKQKIKTFKIDLTQLEKKDTLLIV